MPPTPEQRPDGERLQDPSATERLRVMARTRSQLEQLPEQPAPENESTRKELAGVRRRVETQDVPATLNDINHRNTQIPWEEVEEASGPRIRFSEYGNKPLWRRLGVFLRLTRGGNDSFGTQFRAESLARLSDYQKADIVEQLERLDGRNVNWQTKMVSSLMKSHAEYELSKKGLVREGDAVAATEKVRVQAGDTLESIMRRRNAQEKWDEVKNETVVGPLQHDGPLPPDSFVYFNPGGYPVYISQREDEQPRVPMYRKNPEATAPGAVPAGWKGGAESYRRFEYLQRKLKIGDVLFTNIRRDASTGRNRGYYGVGRILQGTNDADDSFPYIHSAVVVGREPDGRVKIAHLDGPLQKLRYLQEYMLENAGEAISVGRVSEDKSEQLAKNMLEMAQGTTKYSPLKEVMEYGALLAKRRGGGTLTAAEKRRMTEICVCSTVVSKAGAQAGIQELASSPTALDQFKSLRIVESMNFTDAAKRSGKVTKIRLRNRSSETPASQAA